MLTILLSPALNTGSEGSLYKLRVFVFHHMALSCSNTGSEGSLYKLRVFVLTIWLSLAPNTGSVTWFFDTRLTFYSAHLGLTSSQHLRLALREGRVLVRIAT